LESSPYRVLQLPRAWERFYEPRHGRPCRPDMWYFGNLEFEPLTDDDLELKTVDLLAPVADVVVVSDREFKHRKRDAAYVSYLLGAEVPEDHVVVTTKIPWPKDVPCPDEIPLAPGTLTSMKRFSFTIMTPVRSERFSDKALITAALFRALAIRTPIARGQGGEWEATV